MLHVYSCLTEQHDVRLVFLAILICTAACSTSMKLFSRANTEKDRALSWLFVAAAVFGAGVWATQIIEELAYKPGFPISYDAGLTVVSLLAAIGTAWLGMFVAHRYAALARGGAAPAQRGPFGARSADRPYRQHRTGFANWRHRMVRRNLPGLRSRSESARTHGGSVPRSLSSRRSRRV
ncbi:MAG: hypothetical protein CR217_12685 [Beijerinckiaceae bacterium]|nr:MAG: hypothetical protein CR217_12685 [Beijerinckiaceae bacterium]